MNTEHSGRYQALTVYEPVYTTGSVIGLNTNFINNAGGWEVARHPISIKADHVKRVVTGWKQIDDNIQVTSMVIQRGSTSKNYTLTIHESEIRDSALHDYIQTSINAPARNCLPVMFELITQDLCRVVLFPNKVLYSGLKGMYTIVCDDESMILDSLHVTDNANGEVKNINAHQFIAEGTVPNILNKVLTNALFNHIRRINVYTLTDYGHDPDAGILPTGLLTNSYSLVVALRSPETDSQDLGDEFFDPEYLFRTTVPAGFKVMIKYQDSAAARFVFATKKITLTEVLSAMNSKLKLRIRCYFEMINGQLTLVVNCRSRNPIPINITYSDYTILFDQSEQAHLSFQNFDKVPSSGRDEAIALGYPKMFQDDYDTVHPFFRTKVVQGASDMPVVDDMLNAMSEPKVKYHFEDVRSDSVINKDLYMGDTVSFYSADIGRTFLATVNGYTLTYDANNSYSQIIELEVI